MNSDSQVVCRMYVWNADDSHIPDREVAETMSRLDRSACFSELDYMGPLTRHASNSCIVLVHYRPDQLDDKDHFERKNQHRLLMEDITEEDFADPNRILGHAII